MTRKWDPSLWKRSTKLLLGIATIWPIVYLVLFFGTVFSVFLFSGFRPDSPRSCGNIDQIQLGKKIKNNELEELIVKPTEIRSRSRVGRCEYWTSVTHEETRKEILRQAREVDANGAPFVAKITEEAAPNVSPFAVTGFIAVFVVHMLTIVLVLGLIALYIILAINNEQLDQAKKIIWIVLLCWLTMAVMPVYWYLYVWRKPPPASAGAPQQNESLVTP